MKIYVLPVHSDLQPPSQPFRFPEGNADYGVEQDFLSWLLPHHHNRAVTPAEADVDYLPVFWTRYHLNHDYGKTGRAELQKLCSQALRDDSKTFTVCQYGDGPLVDLGKTLLFLSSRKTGAGIDIPLLCSPHRLPWFKPKKKYKASFVGRLSTHPIRKELADVLKGDDAVLIEDRAEGERFFVKTTLESHICLAPRGYAGSSFRLLEAMQLGVVPFLVGDIDTRPFQKFIDWGACSLYRETPREVPAALSSVLPKELETMAHKAAEVYKTQLSFGRWCAYLIEELKARQ